jgi:hypothetical protein
MAGYPRTADRAIERLYEAADDISISVLDELLRGAGLRWEHVGCWTNTTRRRTCEHCGRRRSTLEAAGEALP